MEIKNEIFLYKGNQFFKSLNKLETSNELSGVEHFRLSLLVDKIQKLHESYQEAAQNVLDKYGEESEKGEGKVIPQDSDNYEDALEELEDLNSQSNQIAITKPRVKVKEDTNLNSLDMRVLKDVIDFYVPENKDKEEEDEE